MRYIVSFGGGVTSYEVLRRAIVKHGKENVYPVFADVGQIRDEQGRVVVGEDDDLFRFMSEVEQELGIKITNIKSEKYHNIWDVFFTDRFMGNSQFDPCSKRMKREVLKKWIHGNFSPDDTTLVVGLDWSEPSRCEKYAAAVAPWKCEFLLLDQPHVTKMKISQDLICLGIEPPNLWLEGFSHNNCGGACVNAGHSQWYRLWKNRPHIFRYWEHMEQIFRIWIAEKTIVKGYTLEQLRLRFEGGYIPIRYKNEGCGGACVVWKPGELSAA